MVSRRLSVGGTLVRDLHGRLARDGETRGLVMLGGWTSSVDYWAEETTALAPGRTISLGVTDFFGDGVRGYLTSSVATDSTWGNSTMMDRITTLVDNCQARGYFPEGRVNLHGSSMGGLSALNWAKENPTRVGSISLVVPVVDVQSVYDRDPALFIQASIGAAYGGRPPNASNPADQTDILGVFPIHIWYSEDDYINPEAEILGFAEDVGATTESMGEVSHSFGDLSVYNGEAVARYHIADAEPSTPPPVNNKGFALGGVFAEQTEADQDDDLDAIVGLDAGWIRIDLNWAVIQRDGSTSYDWYTDYAIEGALARGLNVLVAPVYTPGWHKANPRYYPQAATFGNFCRVAAERYIPQGVLAWEIWNEPNIQGGFIAPNATNYMNTCLKPAYQAIKEVDPSATVITAGLAPSPDSAPDINPVTYFAQLYAAGAKPYFDAGAMHPYTLPSVPGGGESWNPWTQMVTMHTIMVNAQDGGKKIWATESGSATDGDPAQPATFGNETLQASIISDGWTEAADLGWVGPVFTYMHRDKTDQPGSATHTREDFFGVLYYDRTEKPSADAFRDGDGNW